MSVQRSPTATPVKTRQTTALAQEQIHNLDDEWAKLTAERQELERLKAEIEEMRNTTTVTRSKGKKGVEIISDHKVVNELVTQMRQTQIDVQVQKFRDENQCNPKEFLIELERYFNLKGVTVAHRIITAESFLDGRAKMWADTMGGNWCSYQEFREEFLREFYSVPIQVRLKNQWLSRMYQWQDGLLQDYFYKQLKSARHFQPEMSMYEINFSIVQQFPMRVREALSTANYEESSAIAQALSQLEQIQREKENNRDLRNPENRRYPTRRLEGANVRTIRGVTPYMRANRYHTYEDRSRHHEYNYGAERGRG